MRAGKKTTRKKRTGAAITQTAKQLGYTLVPQVENGYVSGQYPGPI